MKNNPSLYEINTRVWIKRFGVSTIADIPETYWENLKNKGIDYVWLMGVWKISEWSVKQFAFEDALVNSYRHALKDWKREDVIGSPFAVDVYEVNPLLGDEKSLLDVKSKLNKHGIGLILDFVSNHFSVGSSLFKTNPEIFLSVSKEFFEHDSYTYFQLDPKEQKYYAHGRDPFFPAWQDTAQVNFFCQETRDYLTNTLLKLSKLCDGVRCDMAMLSLNNVFKNTWTGVISARNLPLPTTEFWKDAISKVKNERNDFLFIAEAYWDLEWKLQQHGFDFTYDKMLTDRLRFGNALSVRDHLLADDNYQKKSARFLENHDETRAIAALGKEREKAAAVVMSTVQGMRLYHDGQFEGKKIKLPVQLGREPKESLVCDLIEYYDKLLSITSQEIVKNGKWTLLETEPAWEQNLSYKNLLAWQLSLDKQRYAVVVNYSDIASTCRLKLDVKGYPEEFIIKDLLNDETYIRSAEEVFHTGLYIELKPWNSHILTF